MNCQFRSKRGRLCLEVLEDRLALDATTYVASLYENVLGRTGSAAEVQSWVSSMEEGASVRDVAGGFIASDEYRGIQIRGYYEAYLGRTPGSGEVQGWLEAAQELDEGGENEEVLEQVEEQIAASSESVQRGGSRSGWLANVYQGALGRKMSDQEDDAWLEQLNQEDGDDYLDVAEGIIESSEADTRVVRGAYTQFLARAGSDAEVQSWVSALHDEDHEDFDRAAFYREVLTSTEYQDANGL